MPFERWLHVARMRLQSLISPRQLDRELDDELRDHLEHQIQQHVAAGMTPAAARTAALRALGGIEQRKEECRDARGWQIVDSLVQDVRYALRTLRRNPGFAAAAIIVLGLAIGTNTAMFSVVNGVLLRPLPFPEPDRLVLVSSSNLPAQFGRPPGLSESQFLALGDGKRAFEHVATIQSGTVNLTGAGEPRRVGMSGVTPSFFPILGVSPALGRWFRDDEDQPGRNQVVMLSERLWRTQFGADPKTLGSQVTLDGVSYDVIGIMPAGFMPSGFTFPDDADVWLPFAVRVERGNSLTRPVIGRLSAGASLLQATAELQALTGPRQNMAAADRERWRVEVLPLQELLVGNSRRAIAIFSGVVGFVLLIACANVANLFLVRTSSRSIELSLRTALGASRARVIQQLVTESVVVSLLGGAAGMALAAWGVPALLALAPPGVIPRTETIRLDVFVLVFTLLVSAAAGIFSALGPAFQTTRRTQPLTGSTRSATARQQRLGAVLLVSEIALALILLTGAGLMVSSFLRLRAVDPGYRPEHVVALTVDLPAATYPTAAHLQAFHTRALEKIAAVPTIASFGAINSLPSAGRMILRGDVALERGRSVPSGFLADKISVSPGYFGTMGIRLVRGRDFNDQDRSDSEGVSIVSESVARQLWPGEEPLGQRLSAWSGMTPEWLTVVGVVDDIRQQSLAGPRHRALYQPYVQVTRPFLLRQMTFVVKSDSPNAARDLRAAVREVDPDQAVLSIAPMDDLVAVWTRLPQFQAKVFGTLALLALALTLVGVYGVLAYGVTQRTREIAIRMALGADRADVWSMVLGRTMFFTGVGVAIGVTGALGLTRLLKQFLFQVTPTDPATFGGVVLVIVATAFAAAAIPAWRAARVHPTTALRAE